MQKRMTNKDKDLLFGAIEKVIKQHSESNETMYLESIFKKITGSDEVISVCSNCGIPYFSGEPRYIELPHIPDLLSRIKPGEPMPLGKCTVCDALIHKLPVKKTRTQKPKVEKVEKQPKKK